MCWAEAQTLKVVRLDDNMRQVAVTEGDKVAAQIHFGYEVHAVGLGELATVVDAVSAADADALVEEYLAAYDVADAVLKDELQLALDKNEPPLEIGMEHFLKKRGIKAFKNNVENL